MRGRPIGGRRRAWSKPRHVISIDATLIAGQAGRTLWHELTHAMQCERFDNHAAFIAAYNAEAAQLRCKVARHGAANGRYRRISFEVEAREYEVLAETDPLAEEA